MTAPARNQFVDQDARAVLVEQLRSRGYRLDDRERDILRCRAALGDDHRHHTFAELGRRYGISLSRVRQIEKAAMVKLAADLDDDFDAVPPLTHADLDPTQPAAFGELVVLARPGAPLTPAQARTVLLARFTRTGDQLRQLLGSWLATVDSDNSRAAYLRDISQYFDFCIDRDLDPLTVRIQDFNMYREHLARHRKRDGAPYALSTRQRKIAATSSFYRFLVDTEAVDRSPVTKKARFNYKPTPPDKSLTVEETLILVDDAQTGHQTLGPACAALIIELLFTMGLRVSEVCSLDIDQLTYVRRDSRVFRGITFTGKGNKKHDRGVPDELYDNRIAPYLEQRPQPSGRDADLALLLTLDGRRVDRKQVYRLVRRARQRGLLPHHVSPHWGRHTFALRALEGGFSLEEVQQALGHSSIVTTQGYIRQRNNIVSDPSRVVALALYRDRDTAQSDRHTTDAQHHPGGDHDHPRRSA